jgi:uncharacterized secreted repeat protein (TIGR03808 family)
VLVANNRIDACAFSAVRNNSGSNIQIVSNNCTRAGEVALYSEFAMQGSVIANNLVDDAATGISITNFNDGGRLAVCQGNLVRNLRLYDHPVDKRGTGISVEADTVVSANVIENAPTAGIWIGWGKYQRNVSASANVMRNCAIGIAAQVAAGRGPRDDHHNLICRKRARCHPRHGPRHGGQQGPRACNKRPRWWRQRARVSGTTWIVH